MAEITAAAVKAFRERTGLPLMDCKKALQEAGGEGRDSDRAPPARVLRQAERAQEEEGGCRQEARTEEAEADGSLV